MTIAEKVGHFPFTTGRIIQFELFVDAVTELGPRIQNGGQHDFPATFSESPA